MVVAEDEAAVIVEIVATAEIAAIAGRDSFLHRAAWTCTSRFTLAF
jgi:hypothetical protein